MKGHLFLLVLLFMSCRTKGHTSDANMNTTHVYATADSLQVQAAEFSTGQPIPAKFTCQGSGVSPRITIGGVPKGGVPKGAKSLAMIVEDPDAPSGLFVHWVVFNIPATVTELPEGFAQHPSAGVRQGTNSAGDVGYMGPCPPPGKPHRYYFKVYALDRSLDGLESSATREDLLGAIKGHTLATGETMGTYQRR